MIFRTKKSTIVELYKFCNIFFNKATVILGSDSTMITPVVSMVTLSGSVARWRVRCIWYVCNLLWLCEISIYTSYMFRTLISITNFTKTSPQVSVLSSTAVLYYLQFLLIILKYFIMLFIVRYMMLCFMAYLHWKIRTGFRLGFDL